MGEGGGLGIGDVEAQCKMHREGQQTDIRRHMPNKGRPWELSVVVKAITTPPSQPVCARKA